MVVGLQRFFRVSFEKTYDAWQHKRTIGAITSSMSARMMARMYGYKPKLDEADFRSLVDQIGNDRLWDAKASIGPRGGAAIVAQVEVGAELYRWIVAREILAGMRLRKKSK